MPIDPEALYIQLGHLVANIPDLNQLELSIEAHQWLGRLDALLLASNDTLNLATLRTKVDWLGGEQVMRRQSAQEIAVIAHRALAAAELNAPVSVKGSFIPVGNAFDAIAAISKVFQVAVRDVLIVDPYMDTKALTDFAPLANEGVAIRLLADQQSHKPSLRPAQLRWAEQYGESRPLVVRLAAARILHDRLIIVDNTQTWILTQSLNAFATRSPAAIVRVDDETSAMKIPSYQAIWTAATPL
jgi:hypothetical protein